MIKRFFNKYSTGVLLAPYVTLFVLFIIIPVLAAAFLSLTYFNTIQFPSFTGMKNYIMLFTNDEVFMQNVIPNTIAFAVSTGIGGFALSFFIAWSIAQIQKIPRTILAIIFYSPSLTGGVMITTIWAIVFAGDRYGYLNYFLLKFNFIQKPVLWLQSEDWLLLIMIVVTLWSSMGIGFLSLLAGILNVNEELYEAAYIDGIKNRFQEIIYVTIPTTKPQMLFSAIMAIVGSFSASSIGVQLSGSNPTPNYAGQLIVTHIEDFGFIRYEMGYAAAVSVVLLLIIRLATVGANALFGHSDV